MGIRYYAHAFDGDRTEAAFERPWMFMGTDPLAAGWLRSFRDDHEGPLRSLSLDKAWSLLQLVTVRRFAASRGQQPAYRMFEGQVTQLESGAHVPWQRTLAPAEIGPIAKDLATITEQEVRDGIGNGIFGHGADQEYSYTAEYLDEARTFTDDVATTGGGFSYSIG